MPGLSLTGGASTASLTPASPSPRLHILKPQFSLPPFQLTTFIGREHEILEVKGRLATTRLLALTGVGGNGKTRLAIKLANDLLDAYSHGVCWVDLAPLADSALVPYAVAAALGLREQAGRSLHETLVEYLGPVEVLLVLDNCEHLIEACAALVATLLRACPRIQVLATSREALAVEGELVWPVPPLSVPEVPRGPMRRQHDTTHIAQHAAVRLFIERAQSVRPDFELTSDNAAGIVRICRRLDGIPLAIELAAARVRVLSVEQIANHLDDLFRLLSSTSRTALPRHQTLRAAMDWSYDLLSYQERAVFRRLSAFAGGFTLAAAEAVCGNDEGRRTKDDQEKTSGLRPSSFVLHPLDVLDVLTKLLDKSLVVMGEQGRAARYRLLEPVRQSAWEKLEANETQLVGRRHTHFFLALAEEAEPKLRTKEQRVWLEQLTAEDDNLRTALHWANEHAPDLALRLAGALWYAWYVRGQMSEGRRWLTSALEKTPSATPAARAKALHGVATLALRQGDHACARAWFEESLALRQALGDRRDLAYTLNNLGTLADTEGDDATAESRFEQSLAIFRELGDIWGITLTLNNLGQSAYQRSEYAKAQRWCAESLALSRDLGDGLRVALALNNLGTLADLQGQRAVARAYYEESLTLVQALGEKRTLAETLGHLADLALEEGELSTAREYWEHSLSLFHAAGERRGIALCLEGMSRLVGAEGNAERAVRLLGAADSVRDAIHTPLKPTERRRYERSLVSLDVALGPVALAQLRAEGRAMGLDQAMLAALDPPVERTNAPLKTIVGNQATKAKSQHQVAQPASAARPSLTTRQREVALLVTQGLSNRAIAETLVVGERTVETHVADILSKLGFTSRAQIVTWVLQQGWTKRED